MKLQKIFENMRNNNIYANLDDNYCTTSYIDNTNIKNKGYIGCIYSVSDIDEIMECIIEEGSAIVTYSFYECAKLFKNKDIFTELVISFFNGFDFKLLDDNKGKKLELVITSDNILDDFIETWKIENKKEESDDEYIDNIYSYESGGEVENTEDEVENIFKNTEDCNQEEYENNYESDDDCENDFSGENEESESE